MAHFKFVNQAQAIWEEPCLFGCLLLVAVLLSACSDTAGVVARPQLESNKTPLPTVSSQPLTRESNVNRNADALTQWREIEIDPNARFEGVQFVDSLHGWIAETEKLFRTVDGGATWESLALPSTSKHKARLSKLIFINPMTGWIMSEDYGKDREDHSSRIFRTNDGGKSWTLQFSGADITIWNMSFADDQEGWAVGFKVVQRAPIQYDFFAVHTLDGGENWVDVSGNLSTFADFKKSNAYSLRNVFISAPNSCTVLTGQDQLLETRDGGTTWKTAGLIDSDNRSAHFVRLPNGTFNIAAGSDSKDSKGSVFLTRENGGSWTKNRLEEVCITDALQVATDQIYACGWILPEGSTSDAFETRRFGVVLYSSDNGRNWKVVYESKQAAKLYALSIADKGRLWAVGDGGLVIMHEIR